MMAFNRALAWLAIAIASVVLGMRVDRARALQELRKWKAAAGAVFTGTQADVTAAEEWIEWGPEILVKQSNSDELGGFAVLDEVKNVLIINSLDNEGKALIQKWNDAHKWFPVKAGDRIVSINGEKGTGAIAVLKKKSATKVDLKVVFGRWVDSSASAAVIAGEPFKKAFTSFEDKCKEVGGLQDRIQKWTGIDIGLGTEHAGDIFPQCNWAGVQRLRDVLRELMKRDQESDEHMALFMAVKLMLSLPKLQAKCKDQNPSSLFDVFLTAFQAQFKDKQEGEKELGLWHERMIMFSQRPYMKTLRKHIGL